MLMLFLQEVMLSKQVLLPAVGLQNYFNAIKVDNADMSYVIV